MNIGKKRQKRRRGKLTDAINAVSGDRRTSKRLRPTQENRFLIDRLEERRLLSVDLSQFQQLPTALNDVQGVVSTVLNKNPLPVLGSNLSNEISAFSAQFTTLANNISSGIQNAVDNVQDLTAGLSAAGLTDAAGAALIPTQNNLSSDVEYQAVWNGVPITSNPTVVLNLGLAALGLNSNSQIEFDASVTPVFNIDFGVNTTGFFIDASKTSFELSANVTIDPSSTGLTGTLGGFLQFDAADWTTGNSIYPSDPGNAMPTVLTANFNAALIHGGSNYLYISDLNNLSASGLNMNVSGGLNLGLAMKLGFSLSSSSAQFLTIYSNLDVNWNFNNVPLSTTGVNWDSSSSGPKPIISFDNVAVDLGSFFSTYISPIVTELYKITSPLKPIVDFINKPAPIFNDFGILHDIITAELDSNDQSDLVQNNVVTMGDLMAYGGDETPSDYGGPYDLSPLLEMAQSFQQIYALEAVLGSAPGGFLELGSFSVDQDPRGQSNLENEAGAGSMTDSDVASESDGILGGSGNDPAFTALEPSNSSAPSTLPGPTAPPADPDPTKPSSGVDFPLFRDPSQLFEMLLGKQNINLFTYTSPVVGFDIPFQQSITVYWPFAIDLHGDLSGGKSNSAFQLQAQIICGYNTQGFVDFANTGNASSLLDGFYISDNSYVTFNFGIAADASVNLYLVAAGIGGGLDGQITLSLNDPNQSTDGGEMQLPALAQAFQSSIFGPLEVKGHIDLVLNAFVTFRIGPFSHTFQDNLISITLLQFDSAGDSSAPVLAQSISTPLSNNTLLLNMGPYAGDRQSGDTSDDNEHFTVSLLKTNSNGTENVDVSAFDYNQIYNNVGAVEGFGGNGSNEIDIGPGVDVPVLLYGAFDPTQTLVDSTGSDTINDEGSGPFTIYGGPGNDTIRVNTGNPNDPSLGGVIDGAGGNDMIAANGPILPGLKNILIAGDDYAYTGNGDAQIDSFPTIIGGDGIDDIRTYAAVPYAVTYAYIDSGPGNDTVTEEGSNPQYDTIVAHDGNNGTINIIPNNGGNSVEVYGTGGQNTISAVDNASLPGGTNHGLTVTATAGSGSSATTETIKSLYGSTSGIESLTLDATGGSPTGSSLPAGSLGYTPPAGPININLGYLSQAGVTDIDVNSFAASFPASTANPTTLTIAGAPNPYEVDFDLQQSTTSVTASQSSTSAPVTTNYSGSTLTVAMAAGPTVGGIPDDLETVSFGESLNDQVVYNAGSGTNAVYFYGTPSNAGASLIYNNPAGSPAAVYVNSIGQPTQINQNGGNLTITAGGFSGNYSGVLSNIDSDLTIGGAVPDSSSPTGYKGSLQLILDDSQDYENTANEAGTIFSSAVVSGVGGVSGFGMPLGISFTYLTSLNLTLGEGIDVVNVELGTPIPTMIYCQGTDTINAANPTNSKYPVTILGGGGPDTVYGSGLGDDIVGGYGNLTVTETNISANGPWDTILGGAGNDYILAYGGDESINGGAGNDTIIYGEGLTYTQQTPMLAGGVGSDTIIAYGGDPTIFTDTISGNMASQDGNDFVEGTPAAATIYGGAGVDTFELGAGYTTYPGGTLQINNDFGPTFIVFGTGTGYLYAGPNADTVYGGNSQDFLLAFNSTVDTPLVVATGILSDETGIIGTAAANADVTVSAGATLSLAMINQTIGSLSGAGTVALNGFTLTTGADNASTTFSGSINGSGGLAKSGTGTFLLTTAQSYTGTALVSGGVLQDGINHALPTNIDLTVATGGTFDLNNFSQALGSLAGGGLVTLGTGLLTTGFDDLNTTFSGTITGNGSVSKVGAGLWTLSGASNYTGTTSLSYGTIQAGASNALSGVSDWTVASGATLNLVNYNESIASLSGAGTILMSGGGLTTGGDNASTTFTGAIIGAGSLRKAGTGTFMCQVPLQTGSTTVQAGILRLIGNPDPAPAVYYSFNDPDDTGNTVTNDGTMANKNGTFYNSAEVSGIAGAPGGGKVLQVNTSTGVLLINQTGIGGVSLAGGAWTASLWFDGLYGETSGRYRTAFHSDLSNDAPAVVVANGYTLGSYLTSAFYGSNYNVNSSSLNVTTGWHQLTAVGVGGSSPSTSFYIDGSLVGSIPYESTTEISSIANYYVNPIQTFANYIADVGIYQVSLTPAQVLTLYQQNTQVNTMPSAVIVNGGATFDVNSLVTSIGSLAGAGNVTLGTGSLTTGTDNTNTTFSGVISNSGSVTKTGSGTWTVTNTNTYTGSTTLNGGNENFNSLAALGSGTAINFNGGTLQYATGTSTDISTRTVTINSGGGTIDTNGNNVSYANAIGNSGLGTFTKTGGGTLTLHTAGTWQGSTAITGGTLQAAVVNVLPTATNLTITTSGTFDLNNLNQSIGSLAGDGTAIVTLEAATLTSGAGGNTNSTTFAGDIGGTGILHKIGGSILTLTGSSTFSGGTQIDENPGNNTGGAYGISVSSDVNLGNAGGAVTFPSEGGVLYITASFATNRIFYLDALASSYGDYMSISSGVTLTVNGTITSLAGGNPAPLTLTGLGTLQLNSANTWGANNGYAELSIVTGTVRLGVANAIPDILVGESVGGETSPAHLDLNGFNERIAGLGGGAAGNLLSNVINSSSTPVTLTIDGPSMFDYGGTISGANISVVINGQQEFGSPTSTYGGGTTMISGVLWGAGISNYSNGTIISGPFGTGPITFGATSGSATSQLYLYGGAVEYNPITVVSGGTGIDSIGGILTGNIYNGAITLQHSVSLVGGVTYNGVISGTGNVGINNAGFGRDGGTTILDAVNTYSGSTTVANGTLQFGVNNALPANTAVIIGTASSSGINLNNFNATIGSLTEGSGGTATAGGVTLGTATLTTGNDNTNTVFAGVITGTGGLTKVGTGTFNLSGTSTYTGPTNVSGGILVLQSGGALASTSIIVGSGALMTEAGSLPSNATFNVNGAMDFGGTYTLSSITQKAGTGYNNGLWNGSSGVFSSSAAADGNHLTAVGVIQNNQGGSALYTSTNPFEGYFPAASDILAKRTYYGDANLDGKVDGSDYSRIDNGYLSHLTGWFNGDFNYDGVINGSDYTLIDNAFNTQGAKVAAVIASPSQTGVAIAAVASTQRGMFSSSAIRVRASSVRSSSTDPSPARKGSPNVFQGINQIAFPAPTETWIDVLIGKKDKLDLLATKGSDTGTAGTSRD